MPAAAVCLRFSLRQRQLPPWRLLPLMLLFRYFAAFLSCATRVSAIISVTYATLCRGADFIVTTACYAIR